jgi:hypothetical protein
MIIAFPDSSSALTFCDELNADGAFFAELVSERLARIDRFNRQRHCRPEGSPP